MLSALLVPAALAYAVEFDVPYAWQWPWRVLEIGCLAAVAIMALPTRGTMQRFKVKGFIFILSGYFMFGVGYIGYMTIVISLLHEQGMSEVMVTLFYSLLGLVVVVSSRI